jgi:putative membrane protein
MFAWNWDPLILIGIALQVGVYLACVGPLRARFPGAEPVPPVRVQTFLLGSLVLFIALCSPIETLGDGYLLSAHMIQHLLITLVAPPLWLIGTPRWLFRPLLRLPLALPVGRVITSALFAFLAFNVVFVAWHVPAYYDATLRSTPLHALEHVMFIVTATLTWWPVFSPMDELPRLSDPAQCLYLFLESIPPTILGALITFAGWVLYPTYAHAPRVWGLSAEIDQQAAGLIMWIPGALVYLLVLTVVFFRWFGEDDYKPSQDTRPATR